MRAGNLKAIAIAASVVFAAGCGTTSKTTDSGDQMDHSQQQMDKDSATTSGADGSSMTSGQMGADSGMSKADAMALSNVFYFDFDKAIVKAEAFADLSAHAKYLVANPSVSVVLEGHADERGTREYNLALGERRATAVKNYLVTLGVSAARVSTISYGKERPVAEGHNEQAWSQNRRGVMVVN